MANQKARIDQAPRPTVVLAGVRRGGDIVEVGATAVEGI